MKRKLILSAFFLCAFASISFAQARPVEQAKSENTVTQTAPVSFQARYEGGMFGFAKRSEGTLKFDDDGSRLVFFNKENKEMFHIPYKAMLIVYPTERKVMSGTGRTISSIPLPGTVVGSFIKKKKYYMAIQFDDPDVNAQGTTSFLIDTGALLESVIVALGEKAKLTKRGDAYYRPRPAVDLEDF